MPILAAEPDAYPADLWSEAGLGLQTTQPGDRRWFCFHTRPRQEKAMARQLRDHEIIHYLPQFVHEGRTPQGRKTRSLLPLFTSYLFCWADERERLKALRGNHLVNVLPVYDQTRLVRDLHQIYRMLNSNLKIAPCESHPVGSPVRIIEGPLMGLVGIVDRRGKRDRFTAVVHFFGRGASVELEDWQVERVA